MSWKRYACQIIHIIDISPTRKTVSSPKIIFFRIDAMGILPPENDLMVISIQIQSWKVERKIDPDSLDVSFTRICSKV